MEQTVEARNGQRSSAAMAAWAHRPGDNVFDSVQQLVEHTRELKDRSYAREAAVEHLGIKALGDSMRPGMDSMVVVHGKGDTDVMQAQLNNHSFNQFCQNVGARAGEYRKLPATIAQIPLLWLTQNADRKDVKMLISRSQNGGLDFCRAINSPSYGRIWNHELAEAVAKHVDPDVWTIPEASHIHTKAGFISTNDKKAFIFLANEVNPITLKGMDKPLYRGFYAWNSEVGDGTAGCADFCYNSACANRVMIGLTEFKELVIRHTSGAPDRWIQDAVPALSQYVNARTTRVRSRGFKSTASARRSPRRAWSRRVKKSAVLTSVLRHCQCTTSCKASRPKRAPKRTTTSALPSS